MDKPDSNDRIDRLKQVLADSYPSKAGDPAREPLPESVRAVLRGESITEARPEAPKVSWMERLAALFRTPQFAAVGATAILVLVGVLMLRPPGATPGVQPGPGVDIRSTGPEGGLPSIIVLHGLDDARAAELEASGSFREGQLLRVPAGEDLDSFLESHRRPNLVLVDGRTGEISTPFAEGATEAVPLPADDELAGRILDILASLPEPEEDGE